jgi:hypothetical protein
MEERSLQLHAASLNAVNPYLQPGSPGFSLSQNETSSIYSSSHFIAKPYWMDGVIHITWCSWEPLRLNSDLHSAPFNHRVGKGRLIVLELLSLEELWGEPTDSPPARSVILHMQDWGQRPPEACTEHIWGKITDQTTAVLLGNPSNCCFKSSLCGVHSWNKIKLTRLSPNRKGTEA